MRFIVTPNREPKHTGDWKWELIDTDTGEVMATGLQGTPNAARTAAKHFRTRVHMAPIEMGT